MAGNAARLVCDGAGRRRAVALVAVLGISIGPVLFATARATADGVISTLYVGSPGGVASDPTNGHVYVGEGDDSGEFYDVAVFAAKTKTELARISLPAFPGGVAVDPTNHNVYVTGLGDVPAPVSVINESGGLHTGTVTAEIDLPDISTGEVAVDPTNHNVYVTGQDGIVSVIDEAGGTGTYHVTARVNVGLFPLGLAVDPTNHNVYVAGQNAAGNNVVSVIDESGGSDTGRVRVLDLGADVVAGAIAVNATNHDLYVAGTGPTVSVVDEAGDARQGLVTSTFNLYGLPLAMAFDPTSHNLYVTTGNPNGRYGGGGTLWVLGASGDADTGRVVAGFAVGCDPSAIAVDSATQDAYVANECDLSFPDEGSSGTVSVIGPVLAPPDLALGVGVPAQAADGTEFTQEVTVTDLGPATATNVVTNILEPGGVTLVSAPGASANGEILGWTELSMAPGISVVHDITWRVDSDVHATVAFGGAVEAWTYDPVPANNVAIREIRLG